MMNTNSSCCGGTASTTPCDNAVAELPRYYPRQLITPDDLTLEQDYFRNRMRRHNRLMHGWGVVCGALVCPVTTTASDGSISSTPWQVKVQQGYALGPYGDEIILDCARTVDLRTAGVSGVTGEPCIDAPDPWCSQVFTPPSTTNILYIAAKYKQSMMRPVRVQPVGCGCDDTTCEYSRWHDGYEIGVLTACPTCNACDPNVAPPQFESLFTRGDVPTCPDCSCGPWVCLAKVTLSSDGSGTIQQIDNCSCRRLVGSLSRFWWMCAGTSTTITSVSTSGTTGIPQVPANGTTAVTLTVTGTNLEIGPNVTYSFGSGITVTVSNQTTTLQRGLTTVTLTVTAQSTVASGIYNLTVVDADCSVVIFGNAMQVPMQSASLVLPGSSTSAGGVGNKIAPAPAKAIKASSPAAQPAAQPATPQPADAQPATPSDAADTATKTTKSSKSKG